MAFTGTLAAMTHEQAFALTAEHGGEAASHVSQATTMLVVGEEGWPLEADGGESVKLREVRSRQEAGQPIRILREREWLRLLGLAESDSETLRLSTPAMLSETLNIPVGLIRRWDRLGLIRPVKRVYRLPYFDFQEVAGVRRLAELLEAGVPRRVIERTLKEMGDVLPGLERPLLQLEMLAEDRVVVRDERGLLDPGSRQRLMDFDAPRDSAEAVIEAPAEDDLAATEEQARWSAAEWFEQGCRLLDEDRTAEAVEAFRLCLMERPGDAETQFHLADALYRSGNVAGAIERCLATVELDHNYIEAWTQLGCLYMEQERWDEALEAFEIALRVHPDFPDAVLHKASVLDRLDRREEAEVLWRQYLTYDQRGPWADLARQRLES